MTVQKLNGHGELPVPSLDRSLQKAPSNYLLAIHQLRCGLEMRLLQTGHSQPEQEADRMIRAAFTAPSRRVH